jgi:hypothetical protein
VQRANFANGEELKSVVEDTGDKDKLDYDECLACQ